MKVLTKALICKSEEDAVLSGTFSFRQLMERAGTSAAEIIDKKISCKNKKITVICGNGNNGGDGCVTAQWLYDHGADVTVIFPYGSPQTEQALYFYNKLNNIKFSDTLEDCDILITGEGRFDRQSLNGKAPFEICKLYSYEEYASGFSTPIYGRLRYFSA